MIRPQEEKSPPPKNDVKPSSEIDVDEVLKLAREADEAAKAEPEAPRRGRRKEKGATNGTATENETIRPVVVEPDPEFIAMCQWGVGSVVDIAKQKMDWSDPGIHWKERMSVVIARLINRFQPMEPSWVTDLTIIGGYTALWVIPNVSAERAAKNQIALRNDGKRENVQDAGANSPS